MTLISFRRVLLAAGIVGIFVAATLIVARPQEPLRVIQNQNGSAEERYFVHVSTDKPIYRTGEKVYVRGVFLHVSGHTPMTGTGAASFEIKSQRGETVSSGLVSFADSVLGFSWDIPSTQTGGEYTVRVFNRSSAPAARSRYR